MVSGNHTVKVKIVTSLLTENTHSSTQETMYQYRDEPQVNRVKLLVHVALIVATFSFDFIFDKLGGGRLSPAIETGRLPRKQRCLGYYLQVME